MATAMSLVLTVLALCGFPLMSEGTIAIEPYYMDNHCSSTVQISETSMKSMYLFMKTPSYKTVPSCDMTIEAPPGYRLLFTIRSLKFTSPFLCLSSYFEIRDGRSSESQSVTNKLCNNKGQPYTTGVNAFLRYRSASMEDKFEVVVTAYRDAVDGRCTPDEFTCHNQRCIDGSLSCNFRDNCGDYSNNDNCMDAPNVDTLWWLWMLIGIFCFVLLVSVIIAVSCCLCCKNRRPGTVLTTTQVYSSQQGPVPNIRQYNTEKENVIMMPEADTGITNPEKKIPL